MCDVLTPRGQLEALAADLNPKTGGSVQWDGFDHRRGQLAPVQDAPVQNAILSGMASSREYSIYDIAAILPDKNHNALRCALNALIGRGMITSRKAPVPCKVSSGYHIVREMLLYTRR
jgi:hypothetical protein